jgi:hypothetical protein
MPSVGPRANQPGLVGQDDRLHAVAEVELAQYSVHVSFDGSIADEQRGRNLGIRPASPDQLKDLPLALGQFRET